MRFVVLFICFFALISCVQREAPGNLLLSFSEGDWGNVQLLRRDLATEEYDHLQSLGSLPVYYLDIVVADDFSMLSGWQRVYYTNREDIALKELYFRTFANTTSGGIDITSAMVDGSDIKPLFEMGGSAMRLDLPRTLAAGERIKVELSFKVRVPSDKDGKRRMFGYYDGVLMLDYFYPVIPVYNSGGWNIEIPHPNGDLSFNNVSFYFVKITAKADMKIASSGVKVQEQKEGDELIRYLVAGPARDFYIAASRDFIVRSKKVDDTVINSYGLPEQERGVKLALDFTANALESFNKRLGGYPYKELDVVAAPISALGMEYPGIIAMGTEVYMKGRYVLGVPSEIMLESTIAHEIAHQWFYNMVGNDQVDEPWLDEALAQYLTALYYQDARGEAAARSYRDSWENSWQRIDRADIPIGLAASSYSRKNYSPIIYGRGPIFVQLLKDKMGTEAFNDFLRDYSTQFKWKIATTGSFKTMAENYCGCDLTDLFKAWVYPKP